ncbi:MAG: ComEA family DNA-binding protein [Oscillospiraceae bacterium]
MGKVTKTEIFLLVLTLLFAAAAAALFFTGRPRSEGYTVTTQRDDAGPQEPQSGPLNINTATAAQLETLDGIGPVLAQRIVEYRETNGPSPPWRDSWRSRAWDPAYWKPSVPRSPQRRNHENFSSRRRAAAGQGHQVQPGKRGLSGAHRL